MMSGYWLVVYLSFETMDDIERSDSRKVNCVLCRCNRCMLSDYRLKVNHHSKLKWISNGQAVGGLTVCCVVLTS